LPNIQSAMKRVRQDRKRSMRNRRVRTRMRTFVKKAQSAIAEGDQESASGAVVAAVREIDKAAQKGVIHQNNAARRKSRLMQRYNSMA
jgi:small subunit ribosomal protein S20